MVRWRKGGRTWVCLGENGMSRSVRMGDPSASVPSSINIISIGLFWVVVLCFNPLPFIVWPVECGC